jgi:hypothetical protein
MTTIMPNLCGSCTHYDDGKCEAFPQGIPEDIEVWGGDHRLPVPGQVGAVVHELQSGKEQEYEDWTFTYVLPPE